MALPTLLVEMDLHDPTVTATWAADITSYVRAWSSNRGSQHELQRVEAGTASITLDNLSGRFTPQSTSSVYYPNLLPMRRMRIGAILSSGIGYDGPGSYDSLALYDGVYPIFSGFVESWEPSFPEVGKDQIVTVSLVDGFKVLSLAVVSGAFSQQLSSARITAILDAINWPAADRTIATGQSTVPAVTLTNAGALEHMQSIERAEGGRLFMGRDGKVNFQDRFFSLTTPDFGGRTWADDGTGMSYRDITTPFTESLIINDARLTRTGGTEQVAVDTASQNTNFIRSFVEGNIPLVNDAAVADYAQELVSRYKNAARRIENLQDNAMRHGEWDQLLTRELRDRVLIVKHVMGADTISQDSYLEGISHTWVPGEWRTALAVTPSFEGGRWILDDTTFSVLNSTTVLSR